IVDRLVRPGEATSVPCIAQRANWTSWLCLPGLLGANEKTIFNFLIRATNGKISLAGASRSNIECWAQAIKVWFHGEARIELRIMNQPEFHSLGWGRDTEVAPIFARNLDASR